MALPPPRLKMLPAKAARIALVSYRSPSNFQRLLVWDIDTGQVDQVSSSTTFSSMRDVDVSWDGSVWLTPGYDGGLARLGSHYPIYRYYDFGGLDRPGGYFDGPSSLRIPKHCFRFLERKSFSIAGWSQALTVSIGEDDPYVPKMLRDGWVRLAERNTWSQLPSSDHPMLIRQDRVTKKLGPHSVFELLELPDLLDSGVTTATYDMAGDLLVGRDGVLQRYRLEDLKTGIPCFEWRLTNPVDGPRPKRRR